MFFFVLISGGFPIVSWGATACEEREREGLARKRKCGGGVEGREETEKMESGRKMEKAKPPLERACDRDSRWPAGRVPR